jgi:predicted RNase H-like nuclease (RuvC/YqgF family)
VPRSEFDALKREVEALRAENADLRDDVATERTCRESLESQLKQIVQLLLEQRAQAREAAADDMAAREHQRLMVELRDQRRAVSQPRDRS